MFFIRPLFKKMIVDSLSYCKDNKGLQIHGWCLMPNHLHLVISASKNCNLSDILRDFKRHTAKSILKDLQINPKESRRGWMLWMFKQAGSRNPNNKIYQFWRQDNRPMEIASNSFYHQKMDYLHYNPVKEGFCYRPEDYPFSSARWYKDKEGILPIDEILI